MPSDYDIAAELEALMTSLPSAGEDDKEAIETKISTLQYALDNDIPLSSGFLDDESGSGDILDSLVCLVASARNTSTASISSLPPPCGPA